MLTGQLTLIFPNEKKNTHVTYILRTLKPNCIVHDIYRTYNRDEHFISESLTWRYLLLSGDEFSSCLNKTASLNR